MAVETTCPGCRTKYNVVDSMLGQTATCKQCGVAFVVAANTGFLDDLDELLDLEKAAKTVDRGDPTPPALPAKAKRNSGLFRDCPYCGHPQSKKVKPSNAAQFRGALMRCEKCGKDWPLPIPYAFSLVFTLLGLSAPILFVIFLVNVMMGYMEGVRANIMDFGLFPAILIVIFVLGLASLTLGVVGFYNRYNYARMRRNPYLMEDWAKDDD